MVLTGNPDRYKVLPNEGYDGVVEVFADGYSGTGTLLYGGRAVLTAAHVLEGANTFSVGMDTSGGRITLQASKYVLHPLYDPAALNNDLALVWLTNPAPISAERSALFRDSTELGSAVTLVGYGLPGDGTNGHVESDSTEPTKRFAENRFDTTGEALDTALEGWGSLYALPGSQLIIDFDNGSSANDALGILMGINDTGRGAAEGLIAPGDSGGPAYIDNKVAGIASYGWSFSPNGQSADVNDTIDSSFGEVAGFMRVSFYQQWIDQSLRLMDPNAPTRPEDVITSVQEGDTSTQRIYFLLEFNGLRDDVEQWLSVDYATRNGTATAGEDYIATADTLILYPGEMQAVIVVEVIGDSLPEPDETFYLDVFNPQGGSFGEGIAMLTAVRNIVDDDSWA